ncbi:serine aminopeptidase domain-containing protein [Aquimarina sediminis]|uniref:serine aminopeptidase domain-containing protein n=1 Tax=Aquimarina sediminis TaxID=2070536 RepID=UPI000CA01B24|nr:alpha/beta hydrolase [Aquimarina sediminis]
MIRRCLSAIQLFLFIVLVTFSSNLNGQELKRKSSLGIMMQPLNDSLITTLKLKSNTGLYISDVLAGSTVENLGMKRGAVLKKLNGVQIKTIPDVFNALEDFRADDSITIEYVFNGKTIIRTGKGIARPKEKYEKANITYGQVKYRDNILRSILYTPKGKKNTPVVFYLQGYTCGSFEFPFSSQHASLKLIRDWVDAGFSVYRIEKPGVGDSQSKINCNDGNFTQEVIAFKEGYKALLNSQAVDTDNIFLFGHSMGGIIAPLLNEVKSPKGIITYGTISKPWYDYMKDLYTLQPKIFNTPQSQISENNKIGLPFLEDMIVNKMPAKDLAANNDYKNYLGSQFAELERGSYIGRSIAYWQTLCEVDIPEAWRNINTNVLAMHGEFDIQAIDDTGAKGIVALVKDKTKATYKLVNKTEHGFVRFNSMQENVNALQNGTYRQHAAKNYNQEVAQITIDWIKAKAKAE